MDRCRYCGRAFDRFDGVSLISEMLCSQKCFTEVWHLKEGERQARAVLKKAEEDRWNSLSEIEQEAELEVKRQEAEEKEEKRKRREEKKRKEKEERDRVNRISDIYFFSSLAVGAASLVGFVIGAAPHLGDGNLIIIGLSVASLFLLAPYLLVKSFTAKRRDG